MFVVKVWWLPPKQTEGKLQLIFNSIVSAVTSVPEFNVKNQNDMLVIFPEDLMKYNLGEKILVEVTILGWGTFFSQSQDKLEKGIGKAITDLYPNATVHLLMNFARDTVSRVLIRKNL